MFFLAPVSPIKRLMAVARAATALIAQHRVDQVALAAAVGLIAAPLAPAIKVAMAAAPGRGLVAVVEERLLSAKLATRREGQTAVLAATSYQRGRLRPLRGTVDITQVAAALAILLGLMPLLQERVARAVGAMAGIRIAAEAGILVLRRGQLIPAVAAGRTLTIHRQEQARQEALGSSLSGILERPAPLEAR